MLFFVSLIIEYNYIYNIYGKEVCVEGKGQQDETWSVFILTCNLKEKLKLAYVFSYKKLPVSNNYSQQSPQTRVL